MVAAIPFDLMCGNLKGRYAKSYFFLTSERGSLDIDDGSIGKLSLRQFGSCFNRSLSLLAEISISIQEL